MYEFKKLDEKLFLVYWIKGEYDEVDMYRELVWRVREFGFLEFFIEIFICFLKEFKEYGDMFRKMFFWNYGEEFILFDILFIEVVLFLEKFERVEDVFEVFQFVMESELLVKRIYECFVEEEKREEFKKVYLSFVVVEGFYYEWLKGEFEIFKELKEK